MLKADKYYIENLNKIINYGGSDENPRPKWGDGTPAHSVFITQVFEEYDISKGEFPITTLRNTAIKTGIKEIFWIYQKQSNDLSVAREMGINWWDEWDIGDGTIGQRYGATVKRYGLMDKLLDGLVNDPFGRRHIINLYQYMDMEESEGLNPCAYETIWSVRKVGDYTVLDMTLIQRSGDFLTASSINRGQYLALQMMVAGHCGYKVGKFCYFGQNLHVYDRHIKYVYELLDREPLTDQPHFILKENKNFYDYTIGDFIFVNFDKPQPLSGKLELAV
jgi:thymidylate synthase